MKLAKQIIEAINKDDLESTREEVVASFSEKEMQNFKDFKEFFDAVDVQYSYEEDWKPKKWKPYYEVIWKEYKDGKFKVEG
jgi:hypothetical protein